MNLSLRRVLALLGALSALTACPTGSHSPAPGPDEESCPGEIVDYDGQSYCIIIEEGFLVEQCPSSYPNGRDFDGAVACASAEEIPDELRDEMERRGLVGDSRTCDEATCDARFGIERCTAGQSCSLSCSAGECVSQCEAGSECAVSCSGGDCTRTCLDGATCFFSCSGGGCTFRCAEGSTCATSCTPGGCATTTVVLPGSIASCGELCGLSEGLIPDERTCLREVLTAIASGASVDPGCLDDEAACGACVTGLGMEDVDCVSAFDSCLSQATPAVLDVGGGDPQRCGGTSECLFDCPSGRCEGTCSDASLCLITCSGGHCIHTCEDEASCTFSCSGGDCLIVRRGDPQLFSSCSGGGCYYQYE